MTHTQTPTTIRLWLPVALLIALYLALTAAYTVRPTVHIDLGDYYDSPFLHHFHDREIDAAGQGTTHPWPHTQTQLTLDGQREGVWIATVYAADYQPSQPNNSDPLKGLAMSANNTRLHIARTGDGFMVGVIPPDIAAAQHITLQLEPGLREGPKPPPGLAGSVVLEPARTYRWTRSESNITLNNLGRGAWLLTLDIVTAHPNQQPLNAQIYANDTLLTNLPDQQQLRRTNILIPEKTTSSGDLDLTLRSHTYTDPRPLGMLIADVTISPVQSTSRNVLASIPPWGTLLYSTIIVLALYGCLASLSPQRTWLIPTLASILLIGLGTWALAYHRYPTSFMLPGLALLAIWSIILLLALRTLLMHSIGNAQQHATFINNILLIFFVGYWLKAGAMLYPYFIGIDVHWHMDRVRWILNGDLATLYGVNSPLNESTMPLAEWGHTKPVIPYSPYYHMFAASFALFPWSLETSANMVSVLLDCSHVFMIGLLTYASGLGKCAALLAALLYAILPINYLLHSWGNVPTTSGLWWNFAATMFIVIAWQQLHRPRIFIALVTLLIGAFLFYTVAGVFMGMFLLIFTLFAWYTQWRSGLLEPKKPIIALWLATLAAIAITLLVYYGQYIGPIIERTIPYFTTSFTSSAERIGKEGMPVGEYILRHTRLWSYGLAIPLILTIYWVVDIGITIWRKPSTLPQPTHTLWAAISAWIALTIVFLPLAYKVSMVDKHFFVSIPFMVIATAAVLDRFWQHYWPMRATSIFWYLYLGTTGLHLWITRIITVKQ